MKFTKYEMVNCKPFGIIEAKREDEGHRSKVHEKQSEDYAKAKLKHLKNEPLPFVYVSTGEITRFTDFTDPKPRSRDDLVICEGGDPGRCAIRKDSVPNMKIQKALHRVRVKKMFSIKFLFYFMYYAGMTGLLEKHLTGTTIKHLTGRELKKIEIPSPSFDEHRSIVDELESNLTICDKIKETITLSLQQAETLKQSILKKAFERKLV